MKKIDKKGGIMNALVIVFCILFLMLVFFIFFFILGADEDRLEQRIKTEVQENQIHINLLNFLRTPVNEDEVVADYIAYAMMEETEEEKQQKNMESNIPSSYAMPLDLYNKILLKFYDPDCISLKLELIDASGEILRTRYLGQCGSMEPYSSSVTIPLKEPGNLINITATSGKASALTSTKWCLEQYPGDGSWRCSYYSSLCEGIPFDDLSVCQEEAKKQNSKEDFEDTTIGEIYQEKEEEAEQEDWYNKWIVCEHLDAGSLICECHQVTSSMNPCPTYSDPLSGTPIPMDNLERLEQAHETKEECQKAIYHFWDEYNKGGAMHCEMGYRYEHLK
jgi:hypothetical protein